MTLPETPSIGVGARVNVTIIDLGLARMDGYQGEQRWCEPDEEIFEGEGTSSYLLSSTLSLGLGLALE